MKLPKHHRDNAAPNSTAAAADQAFSFYRLLFLSTLLHIDPILSPPVPPHSIQKCFNPKLAVRPTRRIQSPRSTRTRSCIRKRSVPAGFNGGQTPEHIVHGKFGFKNLHATEMVPVNLNRIQAWIDQKRLDPSRPITLLELYRSKLIGQCKDGIKLLADGAAELKTPIHIVVSKASQAAIAAIEALGGTVTTRFYTQQAIRRVKMQQMHPFISLRWDPVALNKPALAMAGGESLEERVTAMGFTYRLPDPTSRKDIEYYRDAKNRGYLSHTVKEGEGPSLYFKPPVSEEELKQLRRQSAQKGRNAKVREENKLW
ncbi:YmL10 [Elasticomyces elasticus]|nr:YmL10 [Elasticomyces elasticus]